jgi:hypothetical protein
VTTDLSLFSAVVTKRCFKCLAEKPLDEFYRHAQMGDGRLSKCATCTRADVAARRELKLETIRQYDRDRAALPHRIALRKHVSEEWAKKFPERKKAQQAANNALRDGRMGAVDFCEGCGSTSRRCEKHHPDYSRPLLVVWLCKPCHAIADKIRRRLEAS